MSTCNEPWREHAACRDHDPRLWFPTDTGRSETAARAKAICRDCPVSLPCLNWALDNGERFGIWGGLGEQERKRLRRAERSPA